MVTERIILSIAETLKDRMCVTRSSSGGVGAKETNDSSTVESRQANALPKDALYDSLLLSHDVSDIEHAIGWMKLRGYISTFGWGFSPEMGYQLTEKGVTLANSRVLPAEDVRRLSSRAITVKPAIYGISLDPKELWWRVKKMFRGPGA